MAPTKHILLVESDPEWRQRILEGLAHPLVRVATVASGREALDYAAREKPDLVVTAMTLSDMSGLGLCRLVREDPALCYVGLLMVSAYASEIDRILAFEAGVDDFLAKPFFARELGSRAGAILRRSGAARDPGAGYEPAALGLVTLQTSSGAVLVGERRLDLTPREYHLLAALMRQAGRVLTRRQLIAKVWGEESAQTERVVDAHVKSIRRKLGEAKDCLETVRGVGYRFSELAGG
jgi:DNA-binding response OmpR family regulator